MKLRKIFVLLLFAALSCACFVGKSYAGEVGFSKTKVTVGVNEKMSLKFKKPSKKIKWSVSDKKVVKIAKKSGKFKRIAWIKGVKVGSAKVTAKCGKKKYKVKVKVTASVKEDEKTTTTDGTQSIKAADCVYLSLAENKISLGQNLVITIQNTGANQYYLDKSPGILERKDKEQWIGLSIKDDLSYEDIAIVLPALQSIDLEVPIYDYYEDITPGYYRYTKEIGGESFSVEFEIVTG